MVIATDGSQTYVLFLYDEIEFGNQNTQVGFNAGDKVRAFNLPRPLNSSIYHDLVSTSNVGIPGTFMFRVDLDTVLQPAGIISS